MSRRALAAAGVALLLIAGLGYAGRRLWLKSDDALRPVVVERAADARSLLQPPLATRLAAALGKLPAPAASPARLVALTFDDGPYPVTTPLLLQRLRDLGVPATFFAIGRDAEQYPELARAMAAGGNQLADHTLTHPNLDRLSDAGVAAELRQGAELLERIAPDPAERRFFRPPHGRYTLATVRVAQRLGYDTILWSDDPGDWRAVSPQTLRDHILRRATAPEIVLLHSGRTATIAALGDIVHAYRAAGYRFVTVGTMLTEVPAEALNRPAKLPLAPS